MFMRTFMNTSSINEINHYMYQSSAGGGRKCNKLQLLTHWKNRKSEVIEEPESSSMRE